MKVVFLVEGANLNKAKEIIERDPIGRSSIYYKSPGSINLEGDGTYIILDGDPDNCDLAIQELDGIAEEVNGEDAQKVLEAFQESEDAAMEGFGGLFS